MQRRCSEVRHSMKTFLTFALLAGMGELMMAIEYPNSPRGPVVEKLHGIRVPDPYRWLEDLEGEETKRWIRDQSQVTEDYLSQIPGREALEAHVTRLWNVERYGVPTFENGWYLYSKNQGLQNQAVLYVTRDPKEEGRVLLDPNALSAEGTVALKSFEISPNGRYLAYSLSEAGSDWLTWKVRDVENGKDLGDEVKWSKFSEAAWSPDSEGFYYGKFPVPEKGGEMVAANLHKKIFFHKLGSTQDEDELIYERPSFPEQGLYAQVTDDGRYLIISVTQGTDPKNGLFYQDLRKANAPVVELFNQFDASYSLVSTVGDRFLIRTDLNAPMQRLVSVDLKNPVPAAWKEIIPEGRQVMSSVSHVGGVLLASSLKDAKTVVRRYSLNGDYEGELELPGLGTANGFRGRVDSDETFYSFTSFVEPGTIYRYDVVKDQSEVFRAPEVKFDKNRYTVKQIQFASQDGTEVPLFIMHRRGLKREGRNPTLLYGYGGFNVALKPFFSPSVISWMDLGGVFVVANLRGGGEYGEEWHAAGMLGRKQNVFDDFIGAAEYLITEKYTSSEKLAIAGGSNGGLLVGAAMTQRPDLFAAALPSVGVMDMLRFHKFTIGWAWEAEYGKPDLARDFHVLRRYSPLHNLVPQSDYPSTMVITSDHDDRVVPSHSYKFTAALQYAQAAHHPVLIRVDAKAGHGAGTPTRMRIEEVVDKYLFLSKELDFPIEGIELPEEKAEKNNPTNG